MSLLLILSVLKTLLSLVVVALHSIGIHLLLKPNIYGQHQNMYLLNLSILEIVYELTSNILPYMRIYGTHKDTYDYVGLGILSLTVTPWFNIMIALTIDRYFEILFNIKYQHISKRMTKITILASWSIGAVCFVTSAIVKFKTSIEVLLMLRRYVIAPYSGVLVVVLVMTYGFIYRRMSKCDPPTLRRQMRRRRKVANTFVPSIMRRTRNNFVPLWIALTYIFIVILPSFLSQMFSTSTSAWKNNNISFIVIVILNDCCCLSDTLIYIFLNASLRRRFFSMFNCVNDGLRTTTTIVSTNAAK